jgi:hypothetical protein
MTASAALLCLSLLVLVSNINDRYHTGEVKKSIDMLYEDRLIAESYILTLTNSMHQLRETLNNSENGEAGTTTKVSTILATIDQTNSAYEKTKFTAAETKNYKEFKVLCRQISEPGMSNNKMQLTTAALEKLDALSAIQVEESKSIMAKSDQVFNSGKTSSDFAMAIIIIIGLILQALVFASKTLVKTTNVNPSLN